MKGRLGGSVAAWRCLWIAGAACLLAACGGDGDDGGSSGPVTWTPGSFLPAATFAAQCASPRIGSDPATGMPYPDVRGSILTENHWLRAWSHDLYLWYDEIVDRNPAIFGTQQYFGLLKTFERTSSGRLKDQFHYSVPTEEWQARVHAGVELGYGIEWVVRSQSPPRDVRVAYTHPGTPATAPGVELSRGARLLRVGDIDFVNSTNPADVAAAWQALFPVEIGTGRTVTVLDADASEPRQVVLHAAVTTKTPVQHVRTFESPYGRVGYFLFTDHIATAEISLLNAIEELTEAGIGDLVLDLRYNGGGFLSLASQLAYMIAGPVPTAGRVFEELRFNRKHPSTNPVTGQPLAPMPFFTTGRGMSAPAGQPLPSLDLPRVFVLTTSTTCSASEALINALRGVDVEVIQIGATTCGKPYGSYATDNCGTTYSSIQFQGVNAKGFGDYADGFSADPWHPSASVLPGCVARDDLSRPLGDLEEGLLAAALYYQSGQGCPPALGTGASLLSAPSAHDGSGLEEFSGFVPKSPVLQNRILEEPR